MRRKSHVRCRAGEKVEIISKPIKADELYLKIREAVKKIEKNRIFSFFKNNWKKQ
jgi:hypothetical protein